MLTLTTGALNSVLLLIVIVPLLAMLFSEIVLLVIAKELPAVSIFLMPFLKKGVLFLEMLLLSSNLGIDLA